MGHGFNPPEWSGNLLLLTFTYKIKQNENKNLTQRYAPIAIADH